MDKKIVLVVDDDWVVVAQFRWGLKEKADILESSSCRDARLMIETADRLDVIVFDGILGENPGEETYNLSRLAAEKFPAADIVAASSFLPCRQRQMKSGCNIECESPNLLFRLVSDLVV